ncbi:MAG: hypothetical protein CL908_13690 [Deltaproteobacteria bacterium]|nr:hypothetical protein [Deltaproteobacteria bacterium]
MSIRFPSLEFFRALQQRSKEDADAFEKLGVCDTTFGIRVGSDLYRIAFEVYECTEVDETTDASSLDFVLTAPVELWKEMFESVLANAGADAEHTINSLTHLGDVMKVEYEDPEGHDRLYRFMATIQEFLDEAQHLDVEMG